MKKLSILNATAGQDNQPCSPRLVGDIICGMLCSKSTTKESTFDKGMRQEMKKNINLCVDLKTFLHGDVMLTLDKSYHGTLIRDDEDHYVFVENARTIVKRNPRVYDGELITVTRKDDGSYRINFKQLKVNGDFSIDSYAIDVCNEIREALSCLIENS